jgi:DNA end-binding protein Ku
MLPYWKGYLKLALVSCPIALHAACSTAERVAFRQINKATGNRVRQQLVDEETREPVDPEHKSRGYEVARGQYLAVRANPQYDDQGLPRSPATSIRPRKSRLSKEN